MYVRQLTIVLSSRLHVFSSSSKRGNLFFYHYLFDYSSISAVCLHDKLLSIFRNLYFLPRKPESPVVDKWDGEWRVPLDISPQIMPDVERGVSDHARGEFIRWYAGAERKHLTPSVGTVSDGGDGIFRVKAERTPVGESQNGDFIAFWLRGVHLIVDSGCRVETEEEISELWLSGLFVHVCVEQGLGRRGDGVGPECITSLKNAFDFLSLQSDGVESVLKPIDGEEIGNGEFSLLHDLVHGIGRAEADVSMADFELKTVDERHIVGWAMKSIRDVEPRQEFSNWRGGIFVYQSERAVELLSELIDIRVLKVSNIMNLPFNMNFTVVSLRDDGLGDMVAITSGIQADHRLAVRIVHCLKSAEMVVSEEDDVNAGNATGQFVAHILLPCRTVKSPTPSAVKDSHRQVGLFLVPDLFRPFACGLQDFLKFISPAEFIRQPTLGGWCGKSEDSDFQTAASENDIRRKRPVAVSVCDVGRNEWVAASLLESSHRLLSRLDIVVPGHSGVISHLLAHLSHIMWLVRPDMIDEISFWSSLYHVAAVEKYDMVVSILLPIALHEGISALKAALPFSPRAEVVGEVVAVDVGGEEKS